MIRRFVACLLLVCWFAGSLPFARWSRERPHGRRELPEFGSHPKIHNSSLCSVAAGDCSEQSCDGGVTFPRRDMDFISLAYTPKSDLLIPTTIAMISSGVTTLKTWTFQRSRVLGCLRILPRIGFYTESLCFPHGDGKPGNYTLGRIATTRLATKNAACFTKNPAEDATGLRLLHRRSNGKAYADFCRISMIL